MRNIVALFIMLILFALPVVARANHVDLSRPEDSDHDGLTEEEEVRYGSNPTNADTDGDSFGDGEEVTHGYDPLVAGIARMPKQILVDLSEQRLTYGYGAFGHQGSFLISSGLRRTPTPIGTFSIQKKRPVALYRGVGYNYPNTKWNLQFIPQYYIHGAYWHNNFGKPMSHGCVNVSYANMEGLYNWAEEGTPVIIQQ